MISFISNKSRIIGCVIVSCDWFQTRDEGDEWKTDDDVCNTHGLLQVSRRAAEVLQSCPGRHLITVISQALHSRYCVLLAHFALERTCNK